MKHNLKNKKIKSKCIDCGKDLRVHRTKRCLFCWNKFKIGKNNPNWKDGKTFSKCIDCGEKTHSHSAKRCFSCFKKFNIGKNHPSWKNGYPKCIDCGEQLKGRKSLRCFTCRGKYFSKERNYNWKGGPKPIKCIDCGKKILRGSKRCRECQIKWLLKYSQSRKKNKSEIFLDNILKKFVANEYKYVGTGKFWVERYNPDFININGQKKIIEFFGDYWHNWKKFPNIKQKDQRKLKIYKKYGYDCLIIWEKDLKKQKTINRILEFNKRKNKYVKKILVN